MKFTTSIAALLCAVSATAMAVREYSDYPVLPSSMTVSEAAAKCGNQAQLSCCNKAIRSGDTTDIDEGIAAGLLKNVIGGGSGNQGVELFDQCSKLDAQVAVLGIPIQDLLNQQCKQNVACCQSSGADASDDLVGLGLPCIALGSVL
ncbi:hydrophobin family protein [Aspergillus thermomutatus]|uniref:Hydrophobin n=1 Tax=Aspergillus thermomutatus TaxID=41047 RepID=A0A397FXU5_ASPTH|nr:uncharacterized protein CDV56_102674 [Aspergillus thermomutatus]RHZ43562.1 hypothetical protein CDV56_102674 [Aspergillus thermomutatus]